MDDRRAQGCAGEWNGFARYAVAHGDEDVLELALVDCREIAGSGGGRRQRAGGDHRQTMVAEQRRDEPARHFGGQVPERGIQREPGERLAVGGQTHPVDALPAAGHQRDPCARGLEIEATREQREALAPDREPRLGAGRLVQEPLEDPGEVVTHAEDVEERLRREAVAQCPLEIGVGVLHAQAQKIVACCGVREVHYRVP